LAAITPAWGVEVDRMPLQYGEKINAARLEMARAAEKSGRNLPDGNTPLEHGQRPLTLGLDSGDSALEDGCDGGGATAYLSPFDHAVC